jgi:hypothetical protein
LIFVNLTGAEEQEFTTRGGIISAL